MNKNKFRWDIQGLRAIAVLSVVVYHIDNKLLPGGFLGVDIFFIISGYLIIGHIWKDLSKGQFKLSRFYINRTKRLLPALLTMAVIVSIVVFSRSLPGEFYNYTQTLISSLFYVSNFWFYHNLDYFNGDLASSPLLHTWSLSVEEQFYLICPLLLAAMYKYKCHKWAFILLIAIGLVLSELLVWNDQSLAFYASPSRFWQFLIGGAISVFGLRTTTRRVIRELISIFCLGLIFLSFIFYSHNNFPGINAIPITLLSAIIIANGVSTDTTYKFLANPAFTFFGNISYSLYLWHWPVITIVMSELGSQYFGVVKLYVFIASTIFAVTSYYLVEEPIKKIKLQDTKLKLASLTLLIPLVISLAIFTIAKLNYLRFTHQQLNYESYLNYDVSEFRNGTCFLSNQKNNFPDFNVSTCIANDSSKENILLLGDSHAAHFYKAINESIKSNQTLSQVTSAGCKPFIKPIGNGACIPLMSWFYNELISHVRFDQIIISARWSGYDYEKLIETLTILKRHTDEIIILGPVIEYDDDLPRILATNIQKSTFFKHSTYDLIKSIDNELSEITFDNGIRYISIIDIMCRDNKECITTIGNAPIQFDYGHLTFEGANYIWNDISGT